MLSRWLRFSGVIIIIVGALLAVMRLLHDKVLTTTTNIIVIPIVLVGFGLCVVSAFVDLKE